MARLTVPRESCFCMENTEPPLPGVGAVKQLELGAQSCVRVERLGPAAPDGSIQLGDLTIDVASRRVLKGTDPVHLTPTEFDLLVHLAERPARVFTREQLLAQVWGYPGDAGTRTVDSHVRALRRKLGNDVVRTVHGVGYAAGDESPADAVR